jgi:hypothetical protein
MAYRYAKLQHTDSVFDAYAYPRGGAVCTCSDLSGRGQRCGPLSLLTKYANQPVETAQFRIAIEEATGQPRTGFDGGYIAWATCISGYEDLRSAMKLPP